MKTWNLLARTGLAAVVLLVTASPGWADRINLKSGSVVEGTYLGGSSRQVRIEVGGQVQTYEVADIRSIGFNDNASGNQPSARNQQQYPPSQQPQQQQRTTDSFPASRVQSQAIAGVTIPAGTDIMIRMVDSVDSGNSASSQRGQTYRASLDEPIYVDGRQIVPRGADVLTKIVDDQQAGKLQGRNVVTLALAQIWIEGRFLDVTSTDIHTEAGSQGARTAKVVGGTAALGAIIGAIAGGGKGAAIGAGSGAAVGGAATVMTNGPQVKIPSETRLTFKLQAPVSW